jgi:ribosomal protein S18 acetylase RimI-like enzyme
VTIQQLGISPARGLVSHGWIAAARTATSKRGVSAMNVKQLAVTTRPMDDDDAMLLFELYASARAEELSRTGWKTPQQRHFFRMQAQTQEQHFARHYDYLDRRTICINGFSAGRLLVDRTPSGFTIVDIALLPSFRGRGIGSLLIRHLLDEAAELDVTVQLTIPKQNPALRLCERAGFGDATDLGDGWLLTWHPQNHVSTAAAAAATG